MTTYNRQNYLIGHISEKNIIQLFNQRNSKYEVSFHTEKDGILKSVIIDKRFAMVDDTEEVFDNKIIAIFVNKNNPILTYQMKFHTLVSSILITSIPVLYSYLREINYPYLYSLSSFDTFNVNIPHIKDTSSSQQPILPNIPQLHTSINGNLFLTSTPSRPPRPSKASNKAKEPKEPKSKGELKKALKKAPKKTLKKNKL